MLMTENLRHALINDKSQGSDRGAAKRDGIFSDHSTANLLPSTPLKEVVKSVDAWRDYSGSKASSLFDSFC